MDRPAALGASERLCSAPVRLVTAERGSSPRRHRGTALAASIGALALSAAAAGCGHSGATSTEPALLRPGTLTVDLVAQSPTAEATSPTGFHREVIDDIAGRLNLDVAYRDARSGGYEGDLLRRRVDAATPVVTVNPPAGGLETSAPYFEAEPTQVLYGIAVARGPDPGKDSPLLEDLDEALSEMKDDGTLQQIYDKWFPGTDVPDAVLNDATG
jgi:ABC-type amino acid transport substrate-binding protein